MAKKAAATKGAKSHAAAGGYRSSKSGQFVTIGKASANPTSFRPAKGKAAVAKVYASRKK